MQSKPMLSSGMTEAFLDESQLPTDPVARRLRERYIAARFLQFPQPAQALKNTGNVMRWARQLLDDDHPSLTTELLQLALEEDRSQRSLWLFLIELGYLGNDPAAFGELIDAFRQRFPNDEAWHVIETMGRKLIPHDPRFAHVIDPVVLPDWSTPDSALRDELRQQKLHASLTDAMAFHQAR